MENFDINNFDPTTWKLMEFVEEYKWITIAKDWIDRVKEAKKALQWQRIFITKALKADRDKAIKYQKDNIAKEKELVAIIAPIEKAIDDDILAMEMQEEMDKRRESLPIRYEELEKLKLEYDEEFILSMNRSQFMDFLNTEKARLYEEEQEKKRQTEAEAKRLADLKEAEERGRLKAEAKAKEDAEAREKELQQKAEQEKAAKEQAEIQAQLDKEKAEAKAKEEKEKLEKQEAYKQFRSENWRTEDTKNDYREEKEWNKVILWKKVWEFTI